MRELQVALDIILKVLELESSRAEIIQQIITYNRLASYVGDYQSDLLRRKVTGLWRRQRDIDRRIYNHRKELKECEF